MDEKKPIKTCTIESLSHDGRGIARIEGKTVFIENALPAEVVEIQIEKCRPKFDEAKVIKVLQSSLDRVIPACQHFGVCGGCSLQHYDATAQIQFKQQVVLEQLKHFGNVIPEKILPPITSPSFGYRRRARLGVRFLKKKDRVLVGFREKNSRYLTDVKHCEILDPRVGKKIIDIADCIQTLSIREHIPQIEVATSEKEAALVFRHLKMLNAEDKKILKTFGATHGFKIYLQSKGIDSVERLYPETDPFELAYTYVSDSKPMQLSFHPTDFIQINDSVNQKLTTLVTSLLELQTNDTVFDLFCGLGNFTLTFASHCLEAIGVEGDSGLIERAKINAKNNHLENLKFFCANLDEQESFSKDWAKTKATKLFIDPPRAGAERVIEHIQHWNIPHIVYVSCNPATLARDAGVLVHQNGYTLSCLGVVDMFPHTTHIESVGVFKK